MRSTSRESVLICAGIVAMTYAGIVARTYYYVHLHRAHVPTALYQSAKAASPLTQWATYSRPLCGLCCKDSIPESTNVRYPLPPPGEVFSLNIRSAIFFKVSGTFLFMESPFKSGPRRFFTKVMEISKGQRGLFTSWLTTL